MVSLAVISSLFSIDDRYSRFIHGGSGPDPISSLRGVKAWSFLIPTR
jgi:hypothetical protein